MAFRLCLALLLSTGLDWAQARPQTPPPPQTRPPTAPRPGQLPETDRPGDLPPPLNSPAKLLKFQHEEVKKDMEKLVKLVAEVQEEIDKAGENVLPLKTLTKLDDVEKLSRKIRSRLKQ